VIGPPGFFIVKIVGKRVLCEVKRATIEVGLIKHLFVPLLFVFGELYSALWFRCHGSARDALAGNAEQEDKTKIKAAFHATQK
jgi:hypothetical protein